MKKIYCLILLLWSGFSAFTQQNVLILIADDLGADYCGFTPGATDTATMPNIRALLPQAVRFTNAWASPYCSSTRAGMLTGRYSFRHGVGTVITGSGSQDLDSSELSIAEMLKLNSPTHYRTANIGKWHVNMQTPVRITWPTNKFGYDLYKGNFLGELSDYYNWTKITNGVQTDTITTYATTETVNDAIAWLDTLPSNKPFFLWVAFNAPHSPYHLPPANLHTVPGLTGTPQHINANRPLYFKAMIEVMDSEIGRLIQWMKTNNRFDSTTIIFMGDNGNDKRVSQVSDSTHVKGTLYDYGVHVPFLISGPKVINPNRSSDALVNVQDVFATCMDVCGFSNWTSFIPSTTTIDSKSLYPVLQNQSNGSRTWAFTELFTPVATANDGKTIRNKEYQLIRFDAGYEEFYHTAVDAMQQNNLLQSGLSPQDIFNYNELCSAMNTLLGSSYCFGALGSPSIATNEPSLSVANHSIQVNYDKEYVLAIYNAFGEKVFQSEVDKGFQVFSCDFLNPGFYVLSVNSFHYRKNMTWVKND